MQARFILLIPVLFFVVSQIISICGAFDALSNLDCDGINDLSLEDIVFIDPFLHSHVEAKTSIGITDPEVCPKTPPRIFYVDELISASAPDWLLASNTKGGANTALSPPCNLWLNNRVLRI